MIKTSKVISIYTADTSGVCSALYEMGGMIVIHDASGCNSTYTTHDEPRWYDKASMIYISALTEVDAILGNDEKLVNDVVEEALKLKPRFIALCGAPVSVMVGTDFEAIAREIEAKTSIKTISLETNGMHSYLSGISKAFYAIAENFCKPSLKKEINSVNILGATPLDFSINGSVESIKGFLSQNDFSVNSAFSMGENSEDILKDIEHAGKASVNLVISYSGLETAKFFEEKFSIPYVVGVPIGEKFSKALAKELFEVQKTKISSYFSSKFSPDFKDSENVLIGESVYMTSLSQALSLDFSMESKVICPLETTRDILRKQDKFIETESEIEKEIKSFKTIIADPLYKPICPKNAKFISLPSEAFSGRCFRKDIKNLICNKQELECFI